LYPDPLLHILIGVASSSSKIPATERRRPVLDEHPISPAAAGVVPDASSKARHFVVLVKINITIHKKQWLRARRGMRRRNLV
jgi:hypothetical protein